MRNLAITALLLAVVAWFGLPAAAATIYVDDDNTTGPWDGSEDCPYQYIGKAISVAANNDTVIVMPGMYTGEDPQDPYGTRKNRNMSISDKTISLVSDSGPEETIIDAEDACQVLNLRNAGTTTIEGFTIKDGKDEWGAGIHVMSSDPTISDCIFVSNRAWGTGSKQGAGLRIGEGCEVYVVDCQFEDNYTSQDGGGIYCKESDLVVENCVFLSNTALSGGGGVYSIDANIEILNCTFTENEQWTENINKIYNGGGAISIYADNASVEARISGCTIVDGIAAVNGGGIRIQDISPVSSGVVSVTIEGCTIAGNTAAYGGGGIWCSGGVHVGNGRMDLVLRDSVLDSNAALCAESTDSGGGMHVGMHWEYTNSCEITNCLFVDNTSSGAVGGLDLVAYSAAVLNSTFANNTAAEGARDLRVAYCEGAVSVTDSIFWASGACVPRIDLSECSASVTYCDVQLPESAYFGTGNINEDPLFVSGPLHDYYLGHTTTGQVENSPCVNTGSDTAANLGMDGLTTRKDSVQDSDQVDMGYHADPVQVEIVDVYWDQSTAQVVITFASVDGIQYTVQRADANEYSDGLTWSNLTSVTATESATTVTDNLSTNPLAGDYRFYRIAREPESASHFSRQTAAVFELELDISFVINQFFISMPLIPDPDHASVQDVLSTQLDYDNVTLDKLIADAGVYARMSYDRITDTWSATQGDPFDIVPGEAYMLNTGLAFPGLHKVRLTGYVPEEALELSVTRASWAVSRRWMAYSMPRPMTLYGLGLPDAITPFWDDTSEVRLLPLNTNVWKRYFYDGPYPPGTNDEQWHDGSLGGPVANPTIACGEGILFIHTGIPGQPDTLVLPKWYVHPPNEW